MLMSLKAKGGVLSSPKIPSENYFPTQLRFQPKAKTNPTLTHTHTHDLISFKFTNVSVTSNKMHRPVFIFY